jgi:hypothetical protein
MAGGEKSGNKEFWWGVGMIAALGALVLWAA